MTLPFKDYVSPHQAPGEKAFDYLLLREDFVIGSKEVPTNHGSLNLQKLVLEV